jgi:Cu+-exporting ATPase
MTVAESDARHLAEHDGTVYAFCSVGCRVRFIREPTAYVESAPQPAT